MIDGLAVRIHPLAEIVRMSKRRADVSTSGSKSAVAMIRSREDNSNFCSLNRRPFSRRTLDVISSGPWEVGLLSSESTVSKSATRYLENILVAGWLFLASAFDILVHTSEARPSCKMEISGFLWASKSTIWLILVTLPGKSYDFTYLADPAELV